MQVFRASKMSDRQVLRLVDDFIGMFEAPYSSSITVGDVGSAYEPGALKDILTTPRQQAISSANVDITSLNLALFFRRGTGGTAQGIDKGERVPSAYFDEIGLRSSNNGVASVENVVRATLLIQKVAVVDVPTVIEEGVGGPMDLLKLQFAQLNDQMMAQHERNDKRQKEIEDRYADRIREIDEEARLAAERAEERFRERDLALQQREEDTNQRKRALDDRDHIHVRRELRTSITKEISDRLQGDLIPRKASQMRSGVFVLLIIGALVLSGLSAWAFYEFAEIIYLASLKAIDSSQGQAKAMADAQLASNAHWLILARGFITGIGAVAFLLSAISWLKSIYHDEVKSRRMLQRYSTDLSRASWAVETIMEAKKNGDVAIPDMIVAGVTRNLFDDEGRSSAETSGDALAALLRTSARAKFSNAGAEFELSGRGASKLADQIDP